MGMAMMGDAMVPLQDSQTFINFMTTVENPLVGISDRCDFYGDHSVTSASVGILQALAATGMVPLSSEYTFLFGQNIGTCITAVLASIGMKVNAKRTTVIHLMFNIFRIDPVYGHLYDNSVCLLDGSTHTWKSGGTDCQCAYNILIL